MDAKTAIDKLKCCQNPGGDIESNHCEADNIPCDLLISLGYEDVVEEYKKVEKWYA